MRRLLAIFATTLLVSSCAWAPGAHLDSDEDYASGEPLSQEELNQRVDIHPITPQLLSRLQHNNPAPNYSPIRSLSNNDKITTTSWVAAIF